MTEDEAKTKLCFRAPTFGASQQLADGPGPHCVGSACMAWQVMERVEIRHKYSGQVVPPDSWRMRGDYEEIKVADGGNCGLVGASQ